MMVVFGSGPHGLPHGIDTLGRRQGRLVVMVNIVNHPVMDVTEHTFLSRACLDIERGMWVAGGVAAVCTSWSRRLRPAVRGPGEHLWGLPDDLLPAWVGRTPGREYLNFHNALTRGFLAIVRAFVRARVDFWFEQPGDAMPLQATGSLLPNRFWDKRAARTASIFRTPEWLGIEREAVEFMGGQYVHLFQCSFGSLAHKPTTFFSTGAIAWVLAPMAWAVCAYTAGATPARRAAGTPLADLAQSSPSPTPQPSMAASYSA